MLPTIVDILGKTYVVQSVVREEGDYGETWADECRIEIWAKPCEMQQRDTLLHEVLHGIDHELNCKLSEAQIRRMATGLLQVLRHNPEFVAFLTDGAAAHS